MRNRRPVDKTLHDARGDRFLAADIQLRLLRAEDGGIAVAIIQRDGNQVGSAVAAQLLGNLGFLRRVCAFRFFLRQAAPDASRAAFRRLTKMRLAAKDDRERQKHADHGFLHRRSPPLLITLV